MIRCPRCDTENVDTSAYCERCGTLLPSSTQYASSEIEYTTPSPREYDLLISSTVEYTVPSESGYALPADSHAAPPPPPPPGYGNFSTYTSPPRAVVVERIAQRPGANVFSAILYFIAALIAAFGLAAILTTFGTDARIGGLILFFGLGLLVASVVIFVRVRHHGGRLRWYQRLLWGIGATIVAFLFLGFEATIAVEGPVASFLIGSTILLYGFALAVIALW